MCILCDQMNKGTIGTPLKSSYKVEKEIPYSSFYSSKKYAAEPEYKTQKHKGIKLLTDLHSDYFAYLNLNTSTLEHSTSPQQYPCFARPCPKRPRHGFVDSRVIYSKEEKEALEKEVYEVDPEGEILYCLYVPAEFNSVLNSSSLAVGLGNDGATSGDSFSVPICGSNYYKDRYKKSSGLKDDEDLYTEIIKKGYQTYFTQLREGPKVEAANDFIPEKIEVKYIVECPKYGDLVAWEKQVAKFDPGTVVYAEGMSITSHWGVHCVINKIPFITTPQDLKVGDTLEPVGLVDRGVFNWEGFDRGFHYAWKEKELSHRIALAYVLGILHNVPAMGPAESPLVGAAAAFALRVSAGVIAGELRHGLKRRPSREKVYEKTWEKFPYQKLFRGISTFEEGPETLGASGYGGSKWIDATVQTLKLMEAVSRRDSITDIVQQLNTVVNCAHNNGWLFDKIITREVFDYASSSPGMILSTCIDIVYNALTEPKPKRRVSIKRPNPKTTANAVLEAPITKAQCVVRKGLVLHVQYKLEGLKEYKVVNYTDPKLLEKYAAFEPNVTSFANTSTQYVELLVTDRTIMWPDGTFIATI